MSTDGDQEWQRLYRQTKMEREVIDKANERLKSKGREPVDIPVIDLADLDSRQYHGGLPSIWRVMGNLEMFMRCCEAWRLFARKEAR